MFYTFIILLKIWLTGYFRFIPGLFLDLFDILNESLLSSSATFARVLSYTVRSDAFWVY